MVSNYNTKLDEIKKHKTLIHSSLSGVSILLKHIISIRLARLKSISRKMRIYNYLNEYFMRNNINVFSENLTCSRKGFFLTGINDFFASCTVKVKFTAFFFITTP